MTVTIRTKALNWTCGLFATFLGIAVIPPALFYVFWAWVSWDSEEWGYVAFNAAIVLLWIAVPVGFLTGYVRWQKKTGLQ